MFGITFEKIITQTFLYIPTSIHETYTLNVDSNHHSPYVLLFKL